MKAIKSNCIICLVAMLCFNACNSFLDEPVPQQSLPSENAFTTAKDLENHLVGGYSAFKLAGFFGCDVLMCSDLISDNGEWRGPFQQYREIYQHKMQATNAEVNAMWRDGYRAINQANLVIAAIDSIEDPLLTLALANQYLGEALFIRAVAHFELVRYFGLPYGENSITDPGVPIILKGTSKPEDINYPSRNSVKEVYEMAIEDLNTAKDLLPGSTKEGRANRFAALGYLAEIHFQMRDYSAAAEFAQQVMTGPYKLTSSPTDFFITENNDEEIWCVKETSQDNPGRNASLAAFYHISGFGGAVVVTPDLDTNGFKKIVTDSQLVAMQRDSLQYKDLRFTELTSNKVPPMINVEKYEDYVLFSDDAPILRLVKFILMHAEALVRLHGINQVSIDLLNQVRVRSIRVFTSDGTPVANSLDYIGFNISDLTADELIEAIILERRVELCFEGNRFHDLCRLQREVNKDPYDADELRFPIPQREMDINPNLEQNRGY